MTIDKAFLITRLRLAAQEQREIASCDGYLTLVLEFNNKARVKSIVTMAAHHASHALDLEEAANWLEKGTP